MTEQLLTDGNNVNEQQLKCLPLKKARWKTMEFPCYIATQFRSACMLLVTAT